MGAIPNDFAFPSTLTLVAAFLAAASAYGVYTIVYRLRFHPLAKVSGPRYAAVTHWYQFYYDVVQRGRFPWALERMHKHYGPIVRIAPNEVHIADPDFYDVLFASGSQKRNRDHFVLDGFGLPDTVIASEDHDLHRMRRAPLSPFFSTQAIARIEPVVHEKLALLCGRLKQLEGSHEPVNVEAAINAMTTDIITQYCFGKSYDFLKKPDFAADWVTMMMGASEFSNFGRYFPWIPIIMAKMPIWMVKLVDPSIMPLVAFTKDQEKQVEDINLSLPSEEKNATQRTIIHDLLESDLPASEKSLKRVAQEAQTLVSAGSTTTVHFLKTTIYFILADPKVHKQLKAELKEAMPDANAVPPLHVLKQLPYLDAVVKEGSRMTHGPASRLTRIAPNQDLKFQEYILPAGTAISMTHFIQHRNSDIFPEPDEFNPDRWHQDSRKLDKYLVNFSRGARSCLGINLAKVEMYLTLAVLFRRFNFELYDTDRSDVDMAHDFFIPYARTDSKGVRVRVSGADQT